MIGRRGLLRGLGALLAAPAIVRASSLMPVRSLPGPTWKTIEYTRIPPPFAPLSAGLSPFSSFSADVERYIAEEVLPLFERRAQAQEARAARTFKLA